MSILARDCMNPADHVASPDEPLEAAAKKMDLHRISCMPVMEDGRLRGILTKTDVLHYTLGRRKFEGQTVGEAMCPAIVTCGPDTPVAELAAAMRKNHVHHLLVMDREHLVGVISALDLIEPLLRTTKVLRVAKDL